MDKEDIYLDYFRQYLRSYVRRMFGLELIPDNLPDIFNYKGNDRHEYPLYFIWVLPEYIDYYKSDGKWSYVLLGENFTKHMKSLFWYNSYFLDDMHSIMQTVVKTSWNDEKLLQAKLSLGWKLPHTMQGCQKFLWSFIAKLERANKEHSAASAM